MMRRAIKSMLAATAMFLAACSGGTEQSISQAAQIGTAIKVLRSQRVPQAPVPELTPAVLDQLTVSTLEVTLENTGQTAFLTPFSDRRDAGPGALRTWRTADQVQLTLRDGVLVTTRGLGNDLGSSLADAAVSAVQTRRPVSGPHTLFVKTGDNGISTVELRCAMRTLGNMAIDIVQRAFDVVHLQATCTGAHDTITFDYWVDVRDSTVWRSRQWAGPETGYIRTRLLKK